MQKILILKNVSYLDNNNPRITRGNVVVKNGVVVALIKEFDKYYNVDDIFPGDNYFIIPRSSCDITVNKFCVASGGIIDSVGTLNEMGFISIGCRADFDFYRTWETHDKRINITSLLMEIIGCRSPALIMINGCFL